jgi:glyoxylase-like metal-dependent hydrolase (beta-lactamase superfamily II)
MELTEGVYAFPQTIVRESGELIIYPAAVETPKGVLLIDVGDPGTTDQVEDNLDGMGVGWNDVRGVVLTHHDGDHAGGLADVLELTDAVVYAHEECSPYVDGRKYPLKEAPDDRYPEVDVDVDMVEGVSFRTAAGPMDVVFTPGHTPGHVALHFPDERLLLVGDTITADEDGLAPPWEENTPDMDRARESIRGLADLDVERVLCYHGGPVEGGPANIDAVADAMR